MACDMTKIANFSKEKQELIALCVDSYSGEISNYVASNVKTDSASIDAQIRERIHEEILQGADFNHRTYRKYHDDIFEVIEVMLDQMLPEGWKDNEFFNRFVEERRLDLGDTNEFWCPNDALLTVSKFSGNHWDTIRERCDIGSSFNVNTSWYEVHIYNEFERFMKKLDSFPAMIDKVNRSFLQFFQNAIYTAFSGMNEFVPADFTGHGALSTDTEREALLTLAEKVQTANGGKAPVLVGSHTALRKLNSAIPANWIADSAREERKAYGVPKMWEGYELLVLPQVFKKGTFDFELSNDKILLVSNDSKPVKFVYEGESRMKEARENTENMDQSLEYQIQTKAGVAVVADRFIGEWTLA